MPTDIGTGPSYVPPQKKTPKVDKPPSPAEGAKAHEAALQGRYDETQAIARAHAAQDIIQRSRMFSQGTVEKHPATVASIIASSASTQHVRTVAANLEAAFQYARAKNLETQLRHDPDSVNPSYAGLTPEGLQLKEKQGLDVSVEDLAQVFHNQGMQDPDLVRQRILEYQVAHGRKVDQAELDRIVPATSFFSEVTQAGGAAMASLSAPLRWGGETLDDLHLSAVRDVADVTLGAAAGAATIGGRAVSAGVGTVVGAYAGAKGLITGNDYNTDWSGVLHFWQTDRNDPATTMIASLSGWDPNDPASAEGVNNLNFLFGLGGQLVLGRALGTIGELARLPREAGGYFKAETFVDHRILNRGVFSKAAAMLEKVESDTRVGHLLEASKNIDPKLADVLVKGFEKGTDRKTSIAMMKDAYVNYVKDTPTSLKTRLAAIDTELIDSPGNPGLVAEKVNLTSRLEALGNARDVVPMPEWPKYQELRGSLKGATPTTRLGKAFEHIYHPGANSAANLAKLVDNVRDRFTSWSPWDDSRPPGWLTQNAQNWSRFLRTTGVPSDIIAKRIGEMVDWTKPEAHVGMYGEWVKRVTNDIIDHAKFLDEASIDRIRSTLRNDEIYAQRAVVPERVLGEDGVYRTANKNVLDGPTQENEFARSSHAPSHSDVKNLNSSLRDVERRWGGKSWEKFAKLKDQGMAGWRAAVIVPRGFAINLAIQSSESLAAFFEGTGLHVFKHGAQHAGGYLIGHVPLSEAARAAVAERLGFVSEGAAKLWLDEMKQSPEQLGQMMWDAGSSDIGKRIFTETPQFNQRFLSGELPADHPLVRQHFHDLAWEAEHLGDSRMIRSITSNGVEHTASLMLGEGRPGAGVIAEGAKRFYHETDTANVESIRATGVKAQGRTSFGEGKWSYAQELTPEEAAARIADLPEGRSLVEVEMPESAVKGRGTSGNRAVGFREDIAPENIKNVYESGQRLTGEAGSSDLRGTWEDLRSRVEAQYGPGRAGLESFLRLKERQAQVLSGGDPAILDLIGKGGGRTGLRRPNGMDVEALNEELGQLRLNLEDPGTPSGQRISLIDRKAQLLERLDVEEQGHYIHVTDTADVAKLLQEKATEGTYELPRGRWTEVTKKGWMDEEGALQGAQSRFVRSAYGAMKWMNKDIARGGFFRSKFDVWYKRLRDAGWTVEDADAAAAARAAFEVRDWMHDIGNKSSFQRAMRNEVPFLHAWERVAYQYFVKLPTRMGAGMTPLGWAIGSKIATDFMGLMRGLGVIKQEKGVDGEMHDVVYLPNPLNMIDWIPGVEWKGPDQIKIDDPTHFFIPARLMNGELPGLAPQAQFALNEAAQLTGGPLKALSNHMSMDGAFSLQAPGVGLLTKTWEAVTGDVPPWSIGKSRHYQEYVLGRAHDSAIRYAYGDLQQQGIMPPNPADYDMKTDRPQYLSDREDYFAQLKTTANTYFHGIGMTFLLSSVASPVSFRPTTGEERAWKGFLADNGIEGERTPEDYALIDKYLGEHPESFGYSVSYYDRKSKWDKVDDGYASFREAVGNGDVKVLDAAHYRTVLSLHQEWDYRHEEERVALERAGLGDWYKMSAPEQLSHWGAYLKATADSWANFDSFIQENDGARHLYEDYASPTQKAYDRVQEIDRDRYDLIRAGKNPDAMESKVWSKLAKGTDYGTTNEEHTAWYRHVVMNDYYATTQPIYDRIDALEASKAPHAADQQAALYDKLRAINNQYPDIVGPDGVKYPSPEVFQYEKKTQQEKVEKRTGWASLPPAWLTAFQYATTYGEPDGKSKAYFNQEAKVTDTFDQGVAGLSSSSKEYDAWVKWREQSLDYWARANGTMNIRKLEKAPDIVRMSTAGLLPKTDNMDWVVTQANNVAQKLRAAGLSVWGASADAQYYRGWLESYISQMRDPKSKYYDRQLDHFFTLQARATGITFEPALYRKVLFGIEGSFEISYDFSSENQMARRST